MSSIGYIPISVSAATRDELSKKILDIQLKEGGKVSIISIYWDGRNHVCWYYPLKSLGGGVM